MSPAARLMGLAPSRQRSLGRRARGARASAHRRCVFALALGALAGLAPVGCGSDDDPLARSCSGRTVPNCLPFEYSRVTAASVEPERIPVDDPTETLQLRVDLATCEEDAPEPHEVAVSARLDNDSGLGDGGVAPTVFDLLTLRDDGRTEGDAMAKDGVIDVEVTSPFIGGQAFPNREIVLRFEPRAPAQCGDAGCIGGTCRGEPLEIEYQTGPEA